MLSRIAVQRFMSIIGNAAIAVTLFASKPVQAAGKAENPTGFVYVATNQPSGNDVIQYSRSTDGSLTQSSSISTGGLGGTGNGVGPLDPLGSQDSLVLNGTGSLLLVVNAGSNQLSSIAVHSTGLSLISLVSSSGVFPNSVALNGNLVYVLNAHGTPNISGFHVDSAGVLTPIPGSTQALPGSNTPIPHDIRFSPDGMRLIVTDEGNNQIDVFSLSNTGLITGVMTTSSPGNGPFGFKFGRDGVLMNAEANSGSVSTYFLNSNDTLSVISSAVSDMQMAACWISLTGDGKFGFVSNTGSGTLSAYQISGNGMLNLVNTVAASVGSGAPIDSAFSSDSGFLYVVDSAEGGIFIFRVTGIALHLVGHVTGLPQTNQGIAAQ